MAESDLWLAPPQRTISSACNALWNTLKVPTSNAANCNSPCSEVSILLHVFRARISVVLVIISGIPAEALVGCEAADPCHWNAAGQLFKQCHTFLGKASDGVL